MDVGSRRAVLASRGLAAAGLGTFVALVYLGAHLALGALVDRSTPVVPVTATALVAAAFPPVRRATARMAARLVYGDRVSPADALTELAQRMSGAYPAEELLPDLARIAAQGSGAARVRVWLRLGDELVAVAAWPADGPGAAPAPAPLPAGGPLPLPGVDHLLPVRRDDELIGALAVDGPPGRPLSPTDLRLLQDLASQAALVLRNVRLTAELAASLDAISAHTAELRASRQRIVATQDAERRRIERDIHDGAQQHIVALLVQLRVLGKLAERDPERARQVVPVVRALAEATSETLRSLALGIHPPALTEGGLAQALEQHASDSALALRIIRGPLGRYPAEIEAAVYFCCLEALQNATKHAGGAEVAVELSEGAGHLCFAVRDSGAGFTSAPPSSGTGLANMGERLAAVGGELSVSSVPGVGTEVAGRVPVAPAAQRSPG